MGQLGAGDHARGRLRQSVARLSRRKSFPDSVQRGYAICKGWAIQQHTIRHQKYLRTVVESQRSKAVGDELARLDRLHGKDDPSSLDPATAQHRRLLPPLHETERAPPPPQ